MKKRLFVLAACLLPTLHAEPPAVETKPVAPVAEAAETPQFIRVEEGKDATTLQTAVVHFKKGDATVDLLGAIHIADKKYYEALNKRFEGYDALLYEGIGGGKAAASAPEEAEPEAEIAGPPEDADADSDASAPAEEASAPRKANLSGLHDAYEAGAKWLGLAYQMKEIDYRKANFVHADLSLEEFSELQAERKESILSFVLKAGLQEKKKPVKEPNSFKLLASLVSGNKNGLKRELVQTLGAGDDQVSELAGESVIISDRNAKCLEVLASEVAAGKKKLGIFYGAAHFPDMSKRLEAAGWKNTGMEWMTAWDIGK